jgi:sugar phosphate permease
MKEDDSSPSTAKQAAQASTRQDEDIDDNWIIPPPPPRTSGLQRHRFSAAASTSTSTSATPLHPLREGTFTGRTASTGKPSRSTRSKQSANLLFGDSSLESNSLFRRNDHDDSIIIDDLRPTGIAGFFFGFMYEEPSNDSSEDYYDEDAPASAWNPLNVALFATYTLTTAACAVPVILIPTIGEHLLDNSQAAFAFTSRAAASAVMGAACGKFLNGPVGDVFGARRTSVLYSFMLSGALLGLTCCRDATCAVRACFFIEFFQSVQWPCILVILATHYNLRSHSMYEGGIYVTSIAARFGSLLGIPLFSVLLRQSHWRLVSLVGAWVALIGSSVAYLFVSDSPDKVDQPENPLPRSLQNQIANANFKTQPRRFFWILWKILRSVVVTNLVPSLEHVLKSGVFWVVALAHTGSSMVRTSERILGTYFRDTSNGTLSENQAGGLSVFLSFGTILGLVIAGNMFTQRKERQRKWLVTRLYMITIAACYCLAVLAIPRIRYLIDAPGLILFFQVMASFMMGFGNAVVCNHIPGLVGKAFGSNKGLFSAYTDGVAYGLASVVWRIVGSAVEGGSPNGGGWAYGWAAVALLIIMCAILMVEFMEHYFVRASGGRHRSYETIIFA